jgi:hypothetical protein
VAEYMAFAVLPGCVAPLGTSVGQDAQDRFLCHAEQIGHVSFPFIAGIGADDDSDIPSACVFHIRPPFLLSIILLPVPYRAAQQSFHVFRESRSPGSALQTDPQPAFPGSPERFSHPVTS